MEEEKKIEEKPKEEKPQEEKSQEERLKELTIIVFTSSGSEACKPALEEARRIADEEGAKVEEIDVSDSDFLEDVIEGGAVPSTCVVSKKKMECHVGYGPEYKQKLLEIMKRLRERIKSEQ